MAETLDRETQDLIGAALSAGAVANTHITKENVWHKIREYTDVSQWPVEEGMSNLTLEGIFLREAAREDLKDLSYSNGGVQLAAQSSFRSGARIAGSVPGGDITIPLTYRSGGWIPNYEEARVCPPQAQQGRELTTDEVAQTREGVEQIAAALDATLARNAYRQKLEIDQAIDLATKDRPNFFATIRNKAILNHALEAEHKITCTIDEQQRTFEYAFSHYDDAGIQVVVFEDQRPIWRVMMSNKHGQLSASMMHDAQPGPEYREEINEIQQALLTDKNVARTVNAAAVVGRMDTIDALERGTHSACQLRQSLESELEKIRENLQGNAHGREVLAKGGRT